jgi:hypothetical protein
MARVISDISMSLDGFVAGPNPTFEGLLDNLGDATVGLELDRVVDSPAETHLRYRIVKQEREGPPLERPLPSSQPVRSRVGRRRTPR